MKGYMSDFGACLEYPRTGGKEYREKEERQN
jgi:hypothetical protein